MMFSALAVLRSLSAVPPGTSSDGNYPSSKHRKALRADLEGIASSFVRRQESTLELANAIYARTCVGNGSAATSQNGSRACHAISALTRIVIPRKTLRTEKT